MYKLGITLVLAMFFLLYVYLAFSKKNIFLFFAVLPGAFSLLFKPMFFILGAEYELYADQFNVAYYFKGYLFEFIWLFLIVVMVNFFGKSSNDNKLTFSLKSYRDDTRAYYYWFILLLIAFALSAWLVGSQGLASQRTQSLSTLNPAMRYIYPVALFGQLAGFAIMIREVFYRQYRKALFPLVLIILCFSLTNQRGVLLTGILLWLAYAVYFSRISRTKSFFVCFMLFFLAINLKVINTYIVGGSSDEILALVSFIDGPDGAQLQVWSILFTYLETNSHTFGSSLSSGLLGIIPHSIRVFINTPTVTDTLNMFYAPDQYLDLGFGFNGTLTHDLFLSFGWFGLLLAAPVAFLVSRAIARIKITAQRGAFLSSVIIFFAIGTFLGSGFQVLHWYIVPLMIYLLSRIFRIKI